MKILVVGSGGREHAIVWKLAQGKSVKKIYAAPGNGGMRKLAECVSIKADDIIGLADFAEKNKIDFTVTGPELPLVLGITDEFNRRGLKIFGPSKKAAQLEGSKVFAKELMLKYGIPTAEGKVFTKSGEAIEYIKKIKMPAVIKADGLAAGKGVSVCNTRPEANAILADIIDKKIFGTAGDKVIIEECLVGEEVSILAFSDGKNILPLVASQDHKRIFDNDEGPNTGGMGAYSPVPLYTKEMGEKVNTEILQATIKAMDKEGMPYKGILYAGLMITEEGPKVLEYNARFGDPETQAVLTRLRSDLAIPMIACIEGRLPDVKPEWLSNASACVVMASGGYPGDYKRGYNIEGLDSAEEIKGVFVFHAGTKFNGKDIVTDGGRVLGVTALGKDIEDAVNLCYQAVEKIDFKDKYFRKDIARKAIKRMTNDKIQNSK